MDICAVTRPEVFGISISIIPPGIGDVIEFQRSVVAVVLNPNIIHYLQVIRPLDIIWNDDLL